MILFKKIVLVSKSNTCRSIIAEGVMKDVLGRRDPEKRPNVSSRGLVVLFAEPLNPKAVEVMEQHKISAPKKTSTPFTEDDVREMTLYLTMTDKQKEHLIRKYPSIANVYTLREFAGDAGDIAEVHGGTPEDYEMLYEHIDMMVKLAVEGLMSR